MEVKVQLNNIRIAPRKTRQVADLIRNKSIQDAQNLLEFTVKRASDPVLKLLNSAIASAVHDFKLEKVDSLRISEIRVDEGPKLKRSFPMSRGRAYPIMKRTSHIMLTITDAKKEMTKKEAARKAKKEAKKSKAKV